MSLDLLIDEVIENEIDQWIEDKHACDNWHLFSGCECAEQGHATFKPKSAKPLKTTKENHAEIR